MLENNTSRKVLFLVLLTALLQISWTQIHCESIFEDAEESVCYLCLLGNLDSTVEIQTCTTQLSSHNDSLNFTFINEEQVSNKFFYGRDPPSTTT